MGRAIVVAAFIVTSGLGSAANPVRADEADYSNPGVWLCRPGRQDACTQSQDATIIAVDGKMTRVPYHAAKNPPIDCFYVYPTVSTEPGANSDLTVTAAERNVVRAQFERFGSLCRLYAPMYRQVTLTALISNLSGKPMAVDRALAYSDVAAAWNFYLAHDNHGRGFVLVGHSQGSAVLTQLIKNEIDGKPVQTHMLSAILMGTSLPVPKGADVGGAFKNIPVCRSNRQLGCVIAFANFRANVPPPENSRFGRASEGMQAVCANPAALAGGSAPVDAYLSALRISGGENVTPGRFDWTNPPHPVDTPFVKVPGLLTSECLDNEHGSYLSVTVHPTEGGARANDISGDVLVNGKVQEDWGLHLIDANLAMGDLLSVVGEETKAYQGKQK